MVPLASLEFFTGFKFGPQPCLYLLGAQFNNVGCMHNIFTTTFILTFAVSVLAVLKHALIYSISPQEF